MLRYVAFLVALVSVAVGAQTRDGWRVRVDRSVNAQDPDDSPNVKFVPIAGGFHVTTGPAGTFWKPADRVNGDYTVKATFTLLKPSGHVNYYGLVFGGSNIESLDQNYLYFLVAQNGSYVVRHRAGTAVYDVQERTLHDGVKQPDANGRSRNDLEVRVSGATISYLVNGVAVLTTSRTPENSLQALLGPLRADPGAADAADDTRRLINSIQQARATTDGLVGIRVNHQLDVQVEGFTVQKP
jgi:hypothetical protein